MGLKAKIFAAFSAIVFGLLGLVLYITTTETESFEVERITRQLGFAQDRFQNRLDDQRRHAFTMVRTITSDQKYRAFLGQMKDNFFSFAEEIARDTGSDLVVVVDEELEISGVSKPRDSRADMQAHVDQSTNAIRADHVEEIISGVLDTGKGITRVVVLGGKLVNAVFVPLQESVKDDYALGVVMAARTIDDAWVRDLLGNEVDDLTVAFYAGDDVVASDASVQNRQQLVSGNGSTDLTGEVLLQTDRHITLKTPLDGAGATAGYVVAGNLDRSLKPLARLSRHIMMTGLGILVLGLLITLAVAGRIVQPIRRLVDATHHVIDGDYSYRVDNPSSDEVGELSEAFQNMVEGLQEKEQIRNLFGKYVHPSIVSGLIDNPDDLSLEGRHQVQTLMFSDVAGFVGISGQLDAEETVALLNEYLGEMTAEITRADGILDKYLGDGIMAFFGPPFTPGNHALAACQAALKMDQRLGQLRDAWCADGLPPIRARIGLATGEVIVGNIGSEQTRDYTCIGETVNLASRLEGANKYYGTSIIIDAGTRDLLGKSIAVRELDVIKVMGSDDPVRIFEVQALLDDQTARQKEIADGFASAIADYRAGRFEAARIAFEVLAAAPLEDAVSEIFARRCADFEADAPEGWNGVYVMDRK
jgi:class 3 adenylate cyclase